jgi:L-lactate dehydrogenase
MQLAARAPVRTVEARAGPSTSQRAPRAALGRARPSRLRSRSVRLAVTSKSVGIIGTGAVGTACASSLIHKNLVSNIKLFDMNMARNEGTALDLEDSAFVSGTHVEHCETVAQLQGCDIIVITAGVKQKPVEPRTQLIGRNFAVLSTIVGQLSPQNPNTVLVIVSNPVDVLTALVQKLCVGHSPSRIIGSGTYLDSLRLRVALSKKLEVNVKSVHAYMLGEHGDSQVFARSQAQVGGCPLAHLSIPEGELLELESRVRRKAYEIIQRKGETSHGVGEAVAAICSAVMLDRNEVLPVSNYVAEYDAVMGWPAVVNAGGVVRTIPQVLSAGEDAALRASAANIRATCASVLPEMAPVASR